MGMPAANVPIQAHCHALQTCADVRPQRGFGHRCAKLPNAAAGVSMLASGIDCAKIRLPICQNASSASKPVNPRICVRYFMVCVL